MEDEFIELVKVCKSSIKYDGWTKKAGFVGYLNALKDEIDEIHEAYDKKDYENLSEELGDLLHVWIHACLLAEKDGHFKTKDIIGDVKEKILRRKPHILEKKFVEAEEAVKIWKEAKKQEKTEAKLTKK